MEQHYVWKSLRVGLIVRFGVGMFFLSLFYHVPFFILVVFICCEFTYLSEVLHIIKLVSLAQL